MKKLVQDAGLDGRIKIDSAGIIGYHAGEKADPRMRSHAARRGYKLDSVSRPVCTEDFFDFDLIIGMDNRNIDDLKRKSPGFGIRGKDTSDDGIFPEQAV